MGVFVAMLMAGALRLCTAAVTPEPPVFPTQFTATVEITAHLVDRTKPYPPWLRVIHVAYDYEGRRARAEVEAGYEAGRTFLRRYDNKSEYMVRGGAYAECQRAYLSEPMPRPLMPESLSFVGIEDVEGTRCEHWVEDVGTNRIHVYMALVEASGGEGRRPHRVTDEQVLDGVSVPLMTYDWKDVRIGPPKDQATEDWQEGGADGKEESGLFEIPAPYHWRSCTRNIGGFPYLHVFHHYLRF